MMLYITAFYVTSYLPVPPALLVDVTCLILSHFDPETHLVCYAKGSETDSRSF